MIARLSGQVMGRFLVSLALLFPCLLRADIALLLHESTGGGAARFTSAGHAAVYLSNVCMETPTRLRLCQPGEEGSVIGNYTNFGEDKPYRWNVTPVSVYLYGVENPADSPLYADADVRSLLQEHYRQKYLAAVCPAKSCGTAVIEAHWRDTVGNAFARDIYSFRVSTTREQDAEFVRQFNSAPNVNNYNGFTRNCADFARMLLNRYFPHSARADHLNDFGMTSPKAIAKSFSRYGEKRPELMFYSEKFVQTPGPIRRSSDCRKGTEVSFTSKKWFFPMLLRSHELGMMIAAYVLTGRFSPEHTFERHPSQRVAELRLREAALHPEDGSPEHAALAEERRAERESILGDRRIWSDYESRFRPILAQAVQQGLFRDKREVGDYFRELERRSEPELNASGTPVLRIGDATVGLTRATILDGSSDPRLAYKLMLARVAFTLKAAPKNRSTLPQFQSDWDIMTQLGNAERAGVSTPSALGGQ